MRGQVAAVLLRAVHDVPLGVLEERVRVRTAVARPQLGPRDQRAAQLRRLAREHQRIVRVPQRVPELVARVQPALEREELVRARIGRGELRRGGVRLVGQVVGAAQAQHLLDQLAGPGAHLRPRRDVGLLLVVDHEREHLVGGPGEERDGVGQGVPDGDVDHVDPVRAEHPPHPGNPVVEPLHRDEVLLQHVGLVIP